MSDATGRHHPPDPGLGASPGSAGRPIILLGEDDVAVRRVATTILERHGYEVRGAEDGERVLKVFEASRGQVALVVLDQRMPGLGVNTIVTRLLELEPGARVLLMSGYTEPELEPDVRVHLRGFLGKPFRGGELLRAVESALADP
jgi:two-component system, cell cycle sensor histidine kinase and response regulator CckA